MAKFVMSSLSGQDAVPMPTGDPDRLTKFMLVMAGILLIGLLVPLSHIAE